MGDPSYWKQQHVQWDLLSRARASLHRSCEEDARPNPERVDRPSALLEKYNRHTHTYIYICPYFPKSIAYRKQNADSAYLWGLEIAKNSPYFATFPHLKPKGAQFQGL
jgi:hypothetical protein